MKQLPLAIVPMAEPTFANFLPGPNAAALAEVQALLTAPPMPAPVPVYLWGAAGTGKTHLLQALCRAAQVNGQTAGSFDAASPQPWHWSPEWRWVLIDRCDALCEAAQHSAFALFVEAASHGAQVVAAGRLPPVDLPLRNDLKSRLGWGAVLALQALDDEQTRAVLRQQAHRRGLQLPEDVLDYLLTRFTRNLADLVQMLDALDTYALVHGRHITVPLVRALIAETQLSPA